jgi:putative heme-binding domain-containing protein
LFIVLRFSPTLTRLVTGLSLVVFLGMAGAQSTKPKVDPFKLPARPKKEPLPASTLPLQLVKGERIAFVGNSTAERFNLFGHFETMLHLRYADRELVVRNFARPADEVANRQRGSDYTKLDDPLAAFNADTFLCFFGFNESFAGKEGLKKFEQDYENYIDVFTRKYPRDDAGSPPRFVIVSPIAFEKTGDALLPDHAVRNADLKLYAEAAKRVAAKRKVAFVDLLTETEKAFTETAGLKYTVNGFHANEAGDKKIAFVLDEALFGERTITASTDLFEKLRAAVNDKSWTHMQDYRMLNGWYVYGGRRTWDTETFPLEYAKIRAMAAVRDRYVWDIAQSKQVAAKPDDSKTGEAFTPQTRFGAPQQKYSENPQGGPKILPPDDLIKSCKVPDGFEIKLFADESKFPEIAKPVQMSFDSKGRLWVSTMPSYPQWKPGDPKPSDKLVILEDTNGDGVADKSTVFYDKLHCPTGFEFFNGGVLVVDQPRIIFLKDTDGDDKADVVTHVSDGWATEDTHHTVGAFEFNNGGLLHMLEGVAMSTAVETPWGPFRNFGSPGAYVVDPRNWKISHFVTPGYGNPWCYVFNEWGQGICGDGTGANQHWDTPLSSAQYSGRRGLNAVFPTDGMRPVVGSEYIISRHFPDDIQGQFLYACVINMNGIPRWSIADDGAGYKGTRVRNADKTPNDLVKSTDKHFRPVDPQIGPDGALWFGDWANPLIGHMQYSQRDPNRDHIHGRVYRLVNKNKPLLKPVTQHGKSVAELLEQFREYEWRTRYRVRRELQGRPAAEVLPVVDAWVKKLDPKDPAYDRLRCEALWTQQSYHAVDAELAKALLSAKTADARAATVRVIADQRDRLPAAAEWLKVAATDAHPRVVTEAVRGLSYLMSEETVKSVLAAIQKHPGDYYVQYTVDAALSANIGKWRGEYLKGELTKADANAKKLLDNIIATDKKGAQIIPYLQVLLGKDPQPAEARNKAMTALADMKGGSVDGGRQVFRRTCIACHQVGNEGENYGPQMDGKEPVGKRLTRYKLVESIIDPNADVDVKYLSTQVFTLDGKSVTGLLVSETKTEVVIFDGKSKRTIKVADIDSRKQLKQSSMPEGLAGTISPSEFLDLIAFLSSLK